MGQGAKPSTDILIFVEDPGAANGFVDLPDTLKAEGITASMLATGHAVDYLQSMGSDFHQLDPSATAETLLDAWTPKMVLVGTAENKETLGLKLIEEARRRGVPSTGFVDSPANTEYRFRGTGVDPLGFAPDFLLVPDPLTAKQFEALGHPPDRIETSGHPYFDRVRAQGQKLERRGRDSVRADVLPEALIGRLVVVFLAEISDGLNPDEFRRSPNYTLQGRGQSDERTLIVLEEVLDALSAMTPKPYIVLRLHPKNTEDEFAPYSAEIDCLSQSGSADEVVFAADLVVGMTTTLLFEAALMGRPTLSVTPRSSESEWLSSIGLGITPAVHTREALKESLNILLIDPDGIKGKNLGEVINFGALDRMADFLGSLLNSQGGNN